MGLICALKGHDPISEAPAHGGLWCSRCGKAMTGRDLYNIGLADDGTSLSAQALAEKYAAQRQAEKTAEEQRKWKAELELKRIAHEEAERIEQEIKDRFIL